MLTNSGVKNVGGFKVLLEAWETEEDFLRMTSEDILIRWVNYHLKQAGSARTVKNFASDLKDSEVYSILFSQVNQHLFTITSLFSIISIFLVLIF